MALRTEQQIPGRFDVPASLGLIQPLQVEARLLRGGRIRFVVDQRPPVGPRAVAIALQPAHDAAFEQRLGMPRIERERLVQIGGGGLQRSLLP